MTNEESMAADMMLDLMTHEINLGIMKQIQKEPRLSSKGSFRDMLQVCTFKDDAHQLTLPQELYLFILKAIDEQADEFFSEMPQEERATAKAELLKAYLSQCVVDGLRLNMRIAIKKQQLADKLGKAVFGVLKEEIGGPAPPEDSEKGTVH